MPRRQLALLAPLFLALPLACGDDAATGGGGTTQTTSTGAGGQGGSGFVPTTTVREISLAGLDAGQTSVEIPPAALGALFWLRSSATPYTLRLARDEQTVISQSKWIRDGQESMLGVSWALDDLSSQWTLPSGHGDPLPSLGGSYVLTTMPPETDAIAAAAQGTTAGAAGPPHFESAVLRVREGTFTQGAIDFNVFLPAGLAAQEAHLRQVLDLVMSDFGGLSLGNVTFYPISDDGIVLDSEEEAALLQKEIAAVERSPSVSLLVTTTFGEGFLFGQYLRGRSPLPGLPFVHGTPLDSLLFRVSADPAFDAIVVRHELGHFTGLYHSEEAVYGITDPFDDTPDCAAFPDDCEDPASCGCDMSNLMFPVVADGSPRTLSEQQRKVIQGSLVYRDDATVTRARRVVAPAPQYTAWHLGLSSTAVAGVVRICGATGAPALGASDRRTILALAEREDRKSVV